MFNQDIKILLSCIFFGHISVGKQKLNDYENIQDLMKRTVLHCSIEKADQLTAQEISLAENVLLVMVSIHYKKYKIATFHYHQSINFMNTTFAYTVDFKSIHASRFSCRYVSYKSTVHIGQNWYMQSAQFFWR